METCPSACADACTTRAVKYAMSRCPYLGLQTDPETALEFASNGNFCHHASPAAPPNLVTQTELCLTARYVACPVYLLTEKRPLPRHLISADYQRKISHNGVQRGILFAVILVLLAALMLGAFRLRGILSSADVPPEGSLDGVPAQPSPPPIATATAPAPPAMHRSPTSPVTTTAIACRLPDGWILYTVLSGDSLAQLSRDFGIAMNDLLSANCLPQNHLLQPGDQIFVPFYPTSTPLLEIPTSTATETLLPQPSPPFRPLPTYTFTPTSVPRRRPPSPVPPTSTQSPSQTPQPPPPTLPPPSPTRQPTNTVPPEPATPTSPPPP